MDLVKIICLDGRKGCFLDKIISKQSSKQVLRTKQRRDLSVNRPGPKYRY